MKLSLALLAFTILAGCALPYRHTPLMLGHPDIVVSSDELETPNLSP